MLDFESVTLHLEEPIQHGSLVADFVFISDQLMSQNVTNTERTRLFNLAKHLTRSNINYNTWCGINLIYIMLLDKSFCHKYGAEVLDLLYQIMETSMMSDKKLLKSCLRTAAKVFDLLVSDADFSREQTCQPDWNENKEEFSSSNPIFGFSKAVISPFLHTPKYLRRNSERFPQADPIDDRPFRRKEHQGIRMLESVVLRFVGESDALNALINPKLPRTGIRESTNDTILSSQQDQLPKGRKRDFSVSDEEEAVVLKQPKLDLVDFNNAGRIGSIDIFSKEPDAPIAQVHSGDPGSESVGQHPTSEEDEQSPISLSVDQEIDIPTLDVNADTDDEQ
ncbi:hypothetical protein CXQ85_000586 [Candidozyma haemuli]|uniref:Pre-rRNA-processing protein RIX1 N-terminal domain-containing protein n=1 Tax=Candidozyma haemuli TaxID=45357 RepID=A0A2V1AUZ8_9ASCO|nr:hypothetical protein CXQ85_000586 [[Candida] haemuloni]PVH21604.1 hypothetical protein CXQ85_000586 [[Candida] haemuloni]